MSLERHSALDEVSLRCLPLCHQAPLPVSCRRSVLMAVAQHLSASFCHSSGDSADLDKTQDLDERRLIRSALRDLRRREIEDMEAALASKRFRPTRHLLQEDKENQQGSDSSGPLGILSGKLQSIQDLDELTKLLFGTSDYEERKMIRAAIRRLLSERGKSAIHILEPGNLEPQCTMGTAETERETLSEREPIKSQIQELRRQQTQQGRELHKAGSKSGMVLVLDPLVKEMALGLTRPHLESVSPESDLRALASVLPMAQHHPDHSAPEQGQTEPSAGRPRLDSGASDKSLRSERSSRSRPRTDSASSDSSGGPRPRSGTGSSVDSADLVSRKRVDSGVSAEGREAEVPMSSSPTSMDSDTDHGDDGPPHPLSSDITDQDQPDGAILTKPDPASKSGLLNGNAGGQTDSQHKVPVSRDSPIAPQSKAKDSDQNREVLLAPLSRTNSVRDRMRKFTEPSGVPPMKKNSVENGSSLLSQRNPPRAASVFGASLVARGDEPGRPHAGSASSSRTLRPRGDVAGQSQGSVGGVAGSPAEKPDPSPGDAQERNTPAAGPQNIPGGAEDDMKTFLTIEIKDGGGTVPITHMSPRITTTPGQRAELTLGLRATPFKMSSSTLTSASSFKIVANKDP
ncbi:hypothetical protein NHX12_029230 [Muraenolepis orangiensis]|uniref:Smoothelin domain-containing protein n=1 Tax=Muraenolepis orangiensis TaxID=630683 RepID=A0A9Q0EFM3_9TELE|nr:hypothetical protein NHX12_029230 [Muraenolepis orangiensis]